MLKIENQPTKEKEVKLMWNDERKLVFEKLKKALCTAPCLSFPQKNCKYILDTDASFNTIGCVLSQMQNNEEKVIAYGSRKMSKSEIQYCVTRKELLAVYYFVVHFKQYLLGTNFIIRTDHKALQWMMNWERPNTNQYCSWIAELEVYDFTIEHRKGSQHKNADFLSRPPPNPCKQCEILHDNPKEKRNIKLLYLNENDKEKKIELPDIIKIHKDLGHVGYNKLLAVCKDLTINKQLLKNMIKLTIDNCIFCMERKSPGPCTKTKLHQTAEYRF